MLKFRAISFVLLLGILGAAIFWQPGGSFVFAALALVGGFGVAFEMAKMLRNCNVPTAPIFAGSILAIFAGACALDLVAHSRMVSSVCGVVWLAAFFALMQFSLLGVLFAREKKDALLKVLSSVGIVGLLAVSLLPLILLYGMKNAAGIPMVLLYCVLTTKAGDTGGYIVGLSSSKLMKGGNHKIVPGISPKKSWEGTIGGLCFSILASMIFYWSGAGIFAWNGMYPIVGALLFGCGFAGDLTESVLKRVCGVKDSGAIIPGMGGFFDVLDSFIYAAPCFFLLISLTGYSTNL